MRKAWTVRQKIALGPEAEELRMQLVRFRSLLEDVTSAERRTDWFLDEDRREIARALRDSAVRRDDETLKLAATRAAGAWDELFALAPARRIRSPWVGGSEETRIRREEAARVPEDRERFSRMTEVARTAQIDVKTAVERLNLLERRTHGR
ncbi:hypothetical protein OK074_5049 [Actinobacteria bacterium OK074]|nr:hypothetical protein OK074_5049 [Actinobacteria bacterium OK074]